MTGYTLQRPNGREVMLGNDLGPAVAAFAEAILRDGLPQDGALILRHHWEGDGRWCAEGTQLSRIMYAADTLGVWKPDSSGVPSTVADPALARVWAWLVEPA